MAVNARTEEYQHFELFDKPALFTNARIDRSTVPKGWYCYDFRGSDDDPGELRYIEESVVVNHAGSVLMPEKLDIPAFGYLDAWDAFGFLDEADITLRGFCEMHKIPYPAEEPQFHIRPARPDEAGIFYSQFPAEDERLGVIGHVRMDFGRSGNEFWHTWWPRGPEELNSPVFKAELQQVVDSLREDVLKNRFAMERFCYAHGGKIEGGWGGNYGYFVETEHYRYCLRCNPSPGDYNGYLTCYDLDVQRQNMAQATEKELRQPIRAWYEKAFPSDELSGEIRDITFYDFLNCMNHEEDPYELLGVGDSIVRERVFDRAAELLQVDYDVIYLKWLRGAQAPDIKLPGQTAMTKNSPLVGRVTYASGEVQEFTDGEAFLRGLREELPYRPTTGFRYEVLTADPAIRKAVDDLAYDHYGEENPRQLEDYEAQPDLSPTMEGM